VDAFLTGRLKFLHIAQLVAETLDLAAGRGLLADAQDLGEVLATDAAARELALFLLDARSWA
jgi:1-deoxy-D-xylulose 5-phosphate reductoisomerase